MFTGLIEDLGNVKSIKKGSSSAILNIESKISSKVKIGESVAVNGVCLTAVRVENTSFQAEIMAETLQKTNLGCIKSGSKVNLERALQLGGRLDGHLVSGHIDGVGIIKSITTEDIADVLEISTSSEVIQFLVSKGSIAIDGISLTLVDVLEDCFTVSLIPHTRTMTTLGFKKIGDSVNLEVDLLAKYVAKFIANITNGASESKKFNKDISIDLLQKYGFI